MKLWRIGKVFKIVLVVIIFLILYSHLETYWIQTKRTEVAGKDIPASFDGLKLVYVSDIHQGRYLSVSRVRSLVKRINKLNPDIIFLGGDYTQRGSDYIESCAQELKNLEAPMGKFGVLGNHDHWAGGSLVRLNLGNAGITMLDNKAQWIYKGSEKIKLGGVGDMWTDSQDISPTVEDVGEDDFVILLSHNPDYADEIKDHKIDLVLSGHTHGGQVTMFGARMPFSPSFYNEKYRVGVVETEFTKVIISNGIGTAFYPFRFFARPQINEIHLKRLTQ